MPTPTNIPVLLGDQVTGNASDERVAINLLNYGHLHSGFHQTCVSLWPGDGSFMLAGCWLFMLAGRWVVHAGRALGCSCGPGAGSFMRAGRWVVHAGRAMGRSCWPGAGLFMRAGRCCVRLRFMLAVHAGRVLPLALCGVRALTVR